METPGRHRTVVPPSKRVCSACTCPSYIVPPRLARAMLLASIGIRGGACRSSRTNPLPSAFCDAGCKLPCSNQLTGRLPDKWAEASWSDKGWPANIEIYLEGNALWGPVPNFTKVSLPAACLVVCIHPVSHRLLADVHAAMQPCIRAYVRRPDPAFRG